MPAWCRRQLGCGKALEDTLSSSFGRGIRAHLKLQTRECTGNESHMCGRVPSWGWGSTTAIIARMQESSAQVSSRPRAGRMETSKGSWCCSEGQQGTGGMERTETATHPPTVPCSCELWETVHFPLTNLCYYCSYECSYNTHNSFIYFPS